MELNNIIFTLFIIFFGYFFSKYLLLIFKKSKSNLLADNQFQKPQAFHENSTYRLGGIIIFSLLILVFLYLYFSRNIFPSEYVSFCTLFFLLGLVDDLKISIAPKFRLLIMIVFLITLVISNEIYIKKTGLEFLDNLVGIDIFSLMFICLCFLFIINGSNLIDGYNGLLGIHTLIILTNLLFVNHYNGNNDLAFFIFLGILIVIIFLIYNFPKATLFLGDGGSYFLGAFVAISVIKTSIANPEISPFYFCILLFYLFFEVFFSFIRKIVLEKKSPLFPDNKHLHMLLYKILVKKNNNKLKSNYYVSIIINLTYSILIIPSIFMMKNGLFCKYYSLIFFIIYIFSYRIFSNKISKKDYI